MALASRVESIDEDIRLILAEDLSPQAQADVVRQEAEAALAEGEAIDTAALGHTPTHRTLVDGSEVASLDGVKPDSVIVYEFNVWDDLIPFALQALVDHSPERSGRYRHAWIAMVDGSRVVRIEDIPPTVRVMLVNEEPYSRKIDVGHMKMSVPPGHVEAARQDIQNRFGNSVTVEHIMTTLPGGYVLKGRFRKGGQMTYPALVIEPRA